MPCTWLPWENRGSMTAKKEQNPIAELTRTLGGDLTWLRIVVYIGFGLAVAFLITILWVALV